MARSKKPGTPPEVAKDDTDEDQTPPVLDEDEGLPDDTPPSDDILPDGADTAPVDEPVADGDDAVPYDEEGVAALDASMETPEDQETFDTLGDEPGETEGGDEFDNLGGADADTETGYSEADTIDAGAPGTLPAMETPETVEPTAPPPAAPPPAEPERSGGGMGVFGFLLAGVIGGAVGYGAAWFQDQQSATLSEPAPTVDVSGIESDVSSQSERLDALEQAFASMEGSDAPSFDASALEGAQADMAAALNGLVERIDGLEQKIGAVETRVEDVAAQPAMLSPDGSQAMAEQLAEFRSELAAVTEEARAEVEAAKARASELEQQAAAEAEAAGRRAALSDVRAALESGTAYADALAPFDEVPEGLAAPADDGVATLSGLQQDFPSNARAALAEVQTVPEDSDTGSRVIAFLKRQTNARSLEPREGDDTDAILSRAEAALREGDLQQTVAELEALAEPAAAAFDEWMASARMRIAAVEGANALAADMNEN